MGKPLTRIHLEPEEAEQQVLGGLLSEKIELRDISSSLRDPDDFYVSKHQSIYRAMLELGNQSIPITLLTVHKQLEQDGKLDEVGRSLYLTYLTEIYIDSPHYTYYVEEVKRAAIKRKEIRRTQSLLQALESDDVESVHNLGAAIYPDISKELPRIEIEYPTPLAEAAFHGLAGKIVRAIEPHTEADPVALLANLLTAFGNVIGVGAYLKIGADRHYPRLFCVLVGDTAKGRKGSSWSPVRALFDEVEHEWAGNKVQTGLSSGEGLIWAVRDPINKLQPIKEKGRVIDYEEVMIDEGIQDKRLMVVEEEFPRTLKVMAREGNVLSPIIRQAWDNGDLRALTKNSPAKSTGAHISLVGHATRGELIKCLSDVEQANGFANRIIWLSVRRSKALPFGGDYEVTRFKPQIDELGKAVEFARSAGQLVWADETRPLWSSIYYELSEGRSGLIGAMLARTESQVTRLACIYALLDSSREIKIPHLKAALAFWTYSEDSVRYIFHDSTGNPLANRIVEALIANPNGMTRTEISNLLGRHYSADRITEALETLQSLGWANKRNIKTNGRPVEKWFFIDNKCDKSEKSEKS